MDKAKFTTVNLIQRERYKIVETLTDAIFNFLHMFENYPAIIKLIVCKDKKQYDLVKISEVLGSESSVEN